MKTKHAFYAALSALVIGSAMNVVGCGDTTTATTPDLGTVSRDLSIVTPADLSTPAGQPDLVALPPDMGCYGNPMTHVEIINACTTATALPANPTLPLLNKDGTLPNLP